MNKKNSPTIDLNIDSLSYNGGRGVGRHEGIVVFVPGTAPGDRVRVRVVERKARLWEAELVEILEPSPYRRTPPCPIAGRCGGCSWQHVEYAQQVVQKEKIVKDSLRVLAKYGEFQWQPFVSAPSEFGYRNRIQVHIRDGRYGFFAARSRDLVPTDHCLIAEDAINQRLKHLDIANDSRVEIALVESGETVLMRGPRDPHVALFSQVNRAQNENLKNILLSLVENQPSWIADLYAGSGNLTQPLVAQFPQASVYAVELSREAVERGRKALSSVHWQSSDVEKFVAKFAPPPGAGCMVLDPPRPGVAFDVCEQLLRISPQQILYVSCNPTTFARDAERLIKGGRYKLKSVQGLDMFPQTEHVELVADIRLCYR